MNKPEIRAHPFFPSRKNRSASALAQFYNYSMLANGGGNDDRQFFSEKTILWMTTALTA